MLERPLDEAGHRLGAFVWVQFAVGVARVVVDDRVHPHFRAEIERLDTSALERATAAVFEALLPWDGKDAPMSAHVATATAP